MGWLKKVVSAVTKPIEKAVSSVVETVRDVGSFIDDKVIQPIINDPVDAIVTTAAVIYGGPLVASTLGTSAATGAAIAAGTAKTGLALDEGKELDQALREGATAAAVVGATQGLLGSTTPAPVTDAVQVPASDILSGVTAPATDYSLLGGANLPTQVAGMGGGTGLTAELAPLPDVSLIGVQPVDYALTTQAIPGVVGGIGLQQPTMPNIGAMGGGQGLTVPVEGGTVGELGFTPTGATPSLGDPSSFINQPDVLGQPVIQQGTSSLPSLSIKDALSAARLASGLLTPQQQATPQVDMGTYQPAGAVDYSSLLSLLAQRPSTLGLLGTRFQPQPINIASLLG